MLRKVVALLVVGVGAALGVGGEARAAGWQEMHETSDDVRIEIDSSGIATVTHHLRYRIVAGHFKAFDVVGVDPRIELSPDATLTPEKASAKGPGEILARVEPLAKTPTTLRIMIDEGKGLGRGAYVVDVKYRVDLVATKMLTRDGAMWKVAWTAPPAPEGHDGSRVVFEIPTAPTEPRLAGAAESATTLSTLRRSAERDELELVRAHVPRGEAVTWAARIDPKAFPRVTTPELRPPPPVETAPPSAIASNLSRAIVACGFTIITGLLAMLLRAKQKAVRDAAKMRAAKARPLIPIPFGIGPFVYGLVTSAALASLLWWNPIAGALFVSLAMALAAHRAPKQLQVPRGPGEWRPVSDREVLLPRRSMPLPTDALDLGTTYGKIVLVLSAIALGAAGYFLRVRIPQIAIAVPLVAVALLPIFVTGTRAQMPESPIDLAARILRPTRDLVAKAVDLSHVELSAIARTASTATATATAAAAAAAVAVATKFPAIDEVRLACAPRDRMPGLRALEIALATSAKTAMPEVLVRFEEASSTADRVAKIAPGIPIEMGRVPEERVVRLTPQDPTPRATAALVADLVLALEGRRASDRLDKEAPQSAWKGVERRSLVTA